MTLVGRKMRCDVMWCVWVIPEIIVSVAIHLW